MRNYDYIVEKRVVTYTEETHVYTGYEDDDLYAATPGCEHEVVRASGGGVKCRKCPGWFCY